MISGVLPPRPRAYVAAPVAPAAALFLAINWAFDQDGDPTWKDLGILVADPVLVAQLNHLHRLQARGVRIGTTEQTARARSFHGVLIAYCPDAAMLAAAAAVPGARAVAAVAAGTAQHLGDAGVPAAPLAAAPVAAGPRQPLQPSG
ncbi:hypothetical protein [Kocuria marina]|uniref:hypothetical protein n=1 Tax=Kocuria marina TaxID=223184 RepID=UPI0021A7DB1D|nr:hypothetical protein [Kocuria marina]MCT1615582.1 hypothetical protein [Kocuria marina]